MNPNLTRNPVFLSLAALFLITVVSMSVTIVPETKQAIISSYGKVLRIVNAYRPNERFGMTRAGLTFRIPFIEQIQLIDKRVLGVAMEEQRVVPTDRLPLQIDAYARFRITKPSIMYRTIRTEEGLRDQLKTILGSSLRNELGKREFKELLSAERTEVMQNIQKSLNAKAQKYGAMIVDVRIKRADLPKATLPAAYSRMRSSLRENAIAIDSEGQRLMQNIMSEGDATAAATYAASYNKDADFYDFFRAMKSYRVAFQNGEHNGKTSMILSPENDYLRKFRNGR
jgi:modulator of FtsH protease HflC